MDLGVLYIDSEGSEWEGIKEKEIRVCGGSTPSIHHSPPLNIMKRFWRAKAISCYGIHLFCCISTRWKRVYCFIKRSWYIKSLSLRLICWLCPRFYKMSLYFVIGWREHQWMSIYDDILVFIIQHHTINHFLSLLCSYQTEINK